MLDTSAFPALRYRVLFASVAMLVLISHSPAGAAEISWGVRVDVEAGAVNQSDEEAVSETVGAQRGDASASVTQQGDDFNARHNFAFALAASSLRNATLRVLADTVNAASAVAVAQYADTLRLNADRDDQDVYLFWKISGSISGDRDHNTAFITTRPNHAEAHSGQTQNAGDPGDVRLNGNGYVRTHYHIAEAGEISVPILVRMFADSNLGGRVKFDETATTYLQLPDGVTFLGSDSGLLFADRTDFIIRPGEPLPGDSPADVPEPSTLLLFGAGLLTLALTTVKRSSKGTFERRLAPPADAPLR